MVLEKFSQTSMLISLPSIEDSISIEDTYHQKNARYIIFIIV